MKALCSTKARRCYSSVLDGGSTANCCLGSLSLEECFRVEVVYVLVGGGMSNGLIFVVV